MRCTCHHSRNVSNTTEYMSVSWTVASIAFLQQWWQNVTGALKDFIFPHATLTIITIRVFCRNANGNRFCCEQQQQKMLNKHIFTLNRNRKLAIWRHFVEKLNRINFDQRRWCALMYIHSFLCVCFEVFPNRFHTNSLYDVLVTTVGWLPVMVILSVASRYHIHVDTTINYSSVVCLVKRTCGYFHSDQVNGWLVRWRCTTFTTHVAPPSGVSIM